MASGGRMFGCSVKDSDFVNEFPCRQHSGEIIKYFCPQHDSVGCSTCMKVDHTDRYCKKKDITDVAVNIKESKELEELSKDMKSLQTRFDAIGKQKQANCERLKQDKSAILQQIRSVRREMNGQLDKMERELLDEVQEKFNQKIEAIDADIAETQSMLEELVQTLNWLESESEYDVFVACKVGQQKIRNEINSKIKEQEAATLERSLELHIDKYVKLITEEKMKFATLNEKYTLQKIPEVCDAFRSIKMEDDINACIIRSMCSLEDGSLVMADLGNKKLKKLDKVSKNVSKLIDLPDNPVGLCLAGSKHLAVSLINMKKVQFVSLGRKVTLDHSFPVGDRCRGLACCDGLVYICCGGNPDSKRKEGRGRVEVYSLSGDLILCMYDNISWPKYISVTNDGHVTRIYISDELVGVQMRELKGIFKEAVTTCSSGRLPFCLIGSNQICIGEYLTGKLYTHKFTNDRVLMNISLKGKPIALHYDEISSRLFVAMESCNFIKVFDLQSEEDTRYI